VVYLFLSLLFFSLNQAPTTAETEAQSQLDQVLAEAQYLLGEKDFTEAEILLRGAVQRNPDNPEAAFLLGFVLAKQQNWIQAREQFEKAISLEPEHLSAHLELAGVEFQSSRHQEAIRYLREALRLDPSNDYALRFIATLLNLEGSEIEALHYWNQVGEPRVNQIAFRTAREVEAGLLQRLFSFNEGEVLRKEQILDTRWKQESLRLGPPFHLELTPDSETAWDLEVSIPPRSTVSFAKGFLLTNSLRAPLYREVEVAYPAELGSGRQVSASLRWDSDMKRAKASAWFPFVATAVDGLQVGFDLREENWVHTASGTRFIQQTEGFLADYEYVFTGRKSLSIGTGYEHQFLRFVGDPDFPYSPHLIRIGIEWNQLFGLNDADTVQLALKSRYDTFAGPGQENNGARQLNTVLSFPWLIDRKTQSQLELSLGAGVSSKGLPLNHYFILGVGQDNPLPLRAHPTVQSRRKGHGPMGRNYVLANVEFHRRLFNWRTLAITGLTFSDTAMVSGVPFGQPDRSWYQDVGFGVRMGALGRDLLDFLLGVDLKTSSFNFWIGLPD